MKNIRIGSRESALAVRQAELVAGIIHNHHPELSFEFVTMKTTGDMILDRSLDEVGGRGLFVRELDIALRDGVIDFAVHSLKDMPVTTPPDLPIYAFSERENPFDALVLPHGSTEIDLSKPIGCSSARRKLQLKALYPDAEIAGIRGNVQTRLRRVDSGEFSATVLAVAGLNRLGLQRRISHRFTLQEMIPASCQGILALQGRFGEDYYYLSCADDADARAAAVCERAFVRELGGGCSSPIAAYAEITGDKLTLYGLNYDYETGKSLTGTFSGPVKNAEALGVELAQTLGAELSAKPVQK